MSTPFTSKNYMMSFPDIFINYIVLLEMEISL